MDEELATAVWNRACGLSEPSSARGDLALRAMALFDGVAQNGGFLHAVEHFSAEELDAATEGFGYYGLTESASLVVNGRAASTSSLSDDAWNAFDHRYWAGAPEDALWRAFMKKIAHHPGDFAGV